MKNGISPIIGISSLIDKDLCYFNNSIIGSGGAPKVLSLCDDKTIREMVMQCNGVLIPGGSDVNPAEYGEEKLSVCGENDLVKDRWERKLITEAIKQNKPLLCICRGAQFLNVVCGGTLYQDIPTQKSKQICHTQIPEVGKLSHEVNIVKDTPLYELVNSLRITVNSHHHQAVKHVAPTLKIMAMADDGVVEAVYMPSKLFVWGIQWHPEFVSHFDTNSKYIFDAFINHARTR